MKNLYRVVFKSGDLRPIIITEEQHDSLWEQVNNGSRENYIRIMDQSGTRVAYEGKQGAIDRMEELTDRHCATIRYVCDWGCLHDIPKDGVFICDCSKKFGPSEKMWKWLESQGHSILNGSDITDTMRMDWVRFVREYQSKKQSSIL